MRAGLGLTAAVTLLAAISARAQGGGELARCVALEDDAQRLACYDRLFRAASPAPSQAPATAAAAATAASTDDFGKDVDAERRAQAKNQVRELRARVTKVDTLRSGALVITLDNGQVWRQNEPKMGLLFKPGDEILIRSAMLGSYLLQHAGGNTTTRVTRAK